MRAFKHVYERVVGPRGKGYDLLSCGHILSIARGERRPPPRARRCDKCPKAPDVTPEALARARVAWIKHMESGLGVYPVERRTDEAI